MILSSCYAPTPQAGSPCVEGRCPEGLVCASATRTCELVDDPPDADPGCFGNLANICPALPPGAPLVLEGILNTNTSPLCIEYSGTKPGEFCVVAGTTVRVDVTLVAIGSRPLVIVASESIAIAGRIDVASHFTPAISLGAGANPAGCTAANAAIRNGGAGGSFGSAGGNGGTGGASGGGTVAAPPAGAIDLRGGCSGGDGGADSPGGIGGGRGGGGGGAVLLIARNSITITGMINASGAAGEGGNDECGGGGAGSGGMIGLDAPSVTLAALAAAFANGGGGGGGGSGTDPGRDGRDPLPPGTIVALGGDAGDNLASRGGNGAAGTAAATAGGNANESGGGGGGGAGVVTVFPSQSIGGLVSPPPN